MSAPREETRRTSLRLFPHSGTDRGRRRERNEDAVWSGVITTGSGHQVHVLLVADGIGGHAGGDVASKTVVEVMRRVLRQSLAEEEDIERLPNRLLDAVRKANRALRTRINEEPRLKNMGTTLVAALVTEDGRCCVVHMGDSRAYLVRNGTAFLLTVDHTWVLEALRRGRFSPEEARQHPNRHVVNQFLAGQAEIYPDFKVVRPGAYTDPFLLPSESDLLDTSGDPLQLHPGDALVLCTDGLSDVVPPELIADLVNRAKQDPTHAVQALISAANAAGGPDNIGVAVLYAAPADARVPDQTVPFVPPPTDGPGRAPRERRTFDLRVVALAAAILFMLLGAVGFGMWLVSGNAQGQETPAGAAAAASSPIATRVQSTLSGGNTAGTGPSQPPGSPTAAQDPNRPGAAATAEAGFIQPTSTPATLPTFTPSPSPRPSPPAEGEAGRTATAIGTATPLPASSPGPPAADQQATAECQAWAGQIQRLGAPNGSEGPPEVRFEIFMNTAAVNPPKGCQLRIGIGSGKQATKPNRFARCSEQKLEVNKYTCIVREDISLLKDCTQGCRWWAFVVYSPENQPLDRRAEVYRSPQSNFIQWNPGGGGGQQAGGGGGDGGGGGGEQAGGDGDQEAPSSPSNGGEGGKGR